MNKVIDKRFRSCRFVSTIVKHLIYFAYDEGIISSAKCMKYKKNKIKPTNSKVTN